MRKFQRLFFASVSLASLAVVAIALADEPAQVDREPAKVDNPAAPPSTDILDTLARPEKYKLFLQAVAAAELEGELRKTGPFTVFVPTDEAFRKLPENTLDELFSDKARITAIVQGHIVPGAYSARQLAEAKTVKTLAQSNRKTTAPQGDAPLKIDHACIVTSDLAATNGVIHAIDVVLMPK